MLLRNTIQHSDRIRVVKNIEVTIINQLNTLNVDILVYHILFYVYSRFNMFRAGHIQMVNVNVIKEEDVFVKVGGKG
jgi:hypothetical protein